MKCSLCGYEFSHKDAQCNGCVMNKGCKTICCPHCGYQTVEESAVLNWIKKKIIGGNNVGNKRSNR